MSFEKPITYAVKHKDLSTRIKSQSGGIFTAITDYILNKNGRIYGCVLNESFEAVHIGTDNIDDRNKMRGSKYIQSRIGNCFREIKKDLENGVNVLFSGTPCQVDGLRGFLNKDYDNLYCIDIICLGVPSPLVWKDYIKWQEKKERKKCQNVIFRNTEKFGWHTSRQTLLLKDRKGTSTKDSNIFPTIFYAGNILRPSCYNCPYKTIKRVGDISCGDYWGIEKINKDFDDNIGVSLVFINNEKGQALFNEIKENLVYISTKIEDSLQPALVKPFPKPENREHFWDEYRRKSFNKIAKKYGEYGTRWKIKKFVDKIIRKVKKLVVKFIKIKKIAKQK